MDEETRTEIQAALALLKATLVKNAVSMAVSTGNAESEAVKERIRIQNLNSQKGMYAGYIAALRKDAKITMMKMSQIAGCSSADYSAYEHERKEFDPKIYQKCKEYLSGGRTLD